MIDNPLNRLHSKCGEQLPQSKLTDEKVREIMAIVDQRNQLKAELSKLTNKKIAERFGVHYRTIDRVTAFENWTHVL